ncbi:MAG: undecaprenyl-diphosphate phosphatase [Candidatus Parcubacteria bacterium]|nr:undecaprenyl-diphosphate phosphatase [Candidatus Parcubacteria bacterium]
MLIGIIKAIVLGVVEGLTEFLPISSTGHLILVNQWINFSPSFTTMFDIVIQLGAILAVIVYFWPRLWPFSKDSAHRQATLKIWGKTIVGVIPAIILGALLGKMIENKLFNPWVVAIMLLIGGVIILYVEEKHLQARFNSIHELPLQTAFLIGLIQCLSMIPGTSRAAATIIGAMILGASRSAAVEFSFFLAIPTMIAATGYSLLKHPTAMTHAELIILLTGFIAAFVVALSAIKFLLNYIKQYNLKPFGYYRIALGALILVFFLLVK